MVIKDRQLFLALTLIDKFAGGISDLLGAILYTYGKVKTRVTHTTVSLSKTMWGGHLLRLKLDWARLGWYYWS